MSPTVTAAVAGAAGGVLGGGVAGGGVLGGEVVGGVFGAVAELSSSSQPASRLAARTPVISSIVTGRMS
ncbi:MAG: hypothetical protein EHM24_30895 [Acidobacteria bacterium]|nr:MAG: hypothetical protein EHM24_30895 [Acidobacteriota bacterium]